MGLGRVQSPGGIVGGEEMMGRGCSSVLEGCGDVAERWCKVGPELHVRLVLVRAAHVMICCLTEDSDSASATEGEP